MTKAKLKRIAIYSGVIPSTTFIERLILGLAQDGQQILLFGIENKNVRYPKSIQKITYSQDKFSKAWHLLKYEIYLRLFRAKDKNTLDTYLKTHKIFSLNNRVKYYPVLWHRPTIFHIQWAKSLNEWMWVQQFGIKLVLSLRGAHINYSPIADVELADTYRRNFPKVDAFHAVSLAIAKEAINYDAPEERIQVVYSGLDLSDVKAPEKSSNTVFRMLSIGRSHWIKGYHYALDACKILKDQGLKFEYIIIGAIDSIELKYQIQDLNLEDCVRLYPALGFEEVKVHLSRSDLLVISSIKEGLANVALESMLLKTLVLSTDCGGMAELMIHGKNGFLTAIRRPDLMAQQIRHIMILNEAQKKTIIESARATVEEKHHLKGMIEGIKQIYQDDIEKNN